MDNTVTHASRCGTCDNPTYDNVNDGCTPHTCGWPCALCGHPGDVHRDWYKAEHGVGFCRRCHPDKPGYRHDYRAADRVTEK